MLEQLTNNLRWARERIEAACERADRSPSHVRLLPVTKYVPTRQIKGLMDLGLTEFAESRVQDLRRKAAEPELGGAGWSMIGHLQSNKAGQALRIVNEIQSIDSLRIASALSARLQREESAVEVLIQVNTSGEENKYGFAPRELVEILPKVAELPGLSVRGFMTMAAYDPTLRSARNSFRMLRELRDEYAPDLTELSMGMSGDFEVAIEEGATTVRIGSALFEGIDQ